MKYSDIAEFSLMDVIEKIQKCPKIKFGEMKLSDLLLSGDVNDLKLSDYNSPISYGMGVYVFFNHAVPVYVGKADCFLHRLSSHRSIEPRPGWGWNALLQKICIQELAVMTNHTNDNFIDALAIADNFEVVRILLDIEDAKTKLSRFERVIMKGINHQFKGLLNGRIGKVSDDYLITSLNKLML